MYLNIKPTNKQIKLDHKLINLSLWQFFYGTASTDFSLCKYYKNFHTRFFTNRGVAAGVREKLVSVCKILVLLACNKNTLYNLFLTHLYMTFNQLEHHLCLSIIHQKDASNVTERTQINAPDFHVVCTCAGPQNKVASL